MRALVGAFNQETVLSSLLRDCEIFVKLRVQLCSFCMQRLEKLTLDFSSQIIPLTIQYMISWGIEVTMNSFQARMNLFQTRMNSFYAEGRLE